MMNEVADPNAKVWEGFGRALGAEPQRERTIKGASGLEHPVQSIAIDDRDKRLIVVSSETDSRTAALTQVDVQTAHPDHRVLLARPLVYDLGHISRKIAQLYGTAVIDFKAFRQKMEELKELSEADRLAKITPALAQFLTQLGEASKKVTLPPFGQWVDVLRQAGSLDWKHIAKTAQDNEKPTMSLERLTTLDNLELDRRNGICPLPLYEFNETDWQLFADGREDDVVGRLQELDIYQYFFPPPDSLALAVVERGIGSLSEIERALSLAPELGHAYGDVEHVSGFTSIPELLDQLGNAGYIAEGEQGIEVTPEGSTTRTTIRFRPREGLLSKLLNRFNVNLSVSPKDFIPPH